MFIGHARRLLFFSAIALGLYFSLDYFFLQSETLSKLAQKFGSMVLLGFTGCLTAFWFGLGYLKLKIKGRIQSLTSNFDNEKKMAQELTHQFLDGLGIEFKKAIKSYINDLYSDQLSQIKEHKQTMLTEFEQELKLNQKVAKICSFYQKIVNSVTHFEWCQTCKSNSLQKVSGQTQKNEDSSHNDDKEDTILGEALVERFQNRIISPGSAINGKVGAIDDSRVQQRTNEVQAQEESKRASNIFCESLCIKKNFEMQVKIKQEFKSNSDLFD